MKEFEIAAKTASQTTRGSSRRVTNGRGKGDARLAKKRFEVKVPPEKVGTWGGETTRTLHMQGGFMPKAR